MKSIKRRASTTMRAALFLFSTVLLSGVGHAAGNVEVQVGFTPEQLASRVFVGDENDLPIGGRFELSIQPSRDGSGEVLVPKSISEALGELRRALPRWILNTLIMTKGDHGCGVFVVGANNVETDKWLFVENWLWVNWKLAASDSPLRQDFQRFGLNDKMGITYGLRNGFCKYLPSGDLRAATDEIEWFVNEARRNR